MIRTALGILDQNLRNVAGMRPMPRILTWTVNFRCNARCGMCDSWKKTGEGELPTDKALALIHKLPTSISVVRLTGGEPFLRNDLDQLVDALDQHLHPELLHITTNGFLTGRIVDFLSQRTRTSSQPLHLLVSLDGMEELHNEIRGQPFAFRAAVETIREVAHNRERWNVELAINQTVVDERGIAQYDSLHQMLRGMDIAHHVVIAYAESATYSTTGNQDLSPTKAGDFQTATPIDPVKLEQFFLRLEKDFQSLPLGNRIGKQYYLKGIRNRLLHHKGTPNPPCAALGGHMRVYPNGDVPVCQFNSRTIGNLSQEEFATLWNSDAAHAWHSWVRKCPGCWAECEVLPSAFLSGDVVWNTNWNGVHA